MSNAMFVFLIAQAWLMIAVAHPIQTKSNAAFVHASLWLIVWGWVVLR